MIKRTDEKLGNYSRQVQKMIITGLLNEERYAKCSNPIQKWNEF